MDSALKGTSHKSAPGPSGVGYTILKWAHATRPDLLPHIFNLAMAEGVHPWHHATIVVLNKPGKPDYSSQRHIDPSASSSAEANSWKKLLPNTSNATSKTTSSCQCPNLDPTHNTTLVMRPQPSYTASKQQDKWGTSQLS